MRPRQPKSVLEDLEPRQKELKRRLTSPQRALKNLQTAAKRAADPETARASDRLTRTAAKFRKIVRQIALILRHGLETCQFRDLTPLEKARLRAEAQRRKQEGDAYLMPYSEVCDLFGYSKRTFKDYFIEPGLYGKIPYVRRWPAPKGSSEPQVFFRTGDVERLWEEYFGSRPDLLARRRYGTAEEGDR